MDLKGGASATITVVSFAKTKGFPVDGVVVFVECAFALKIVSSASGECK